ncbi:MAG: NAD-dependent epimerase/dehydratase family protein [Kiloniellaceae bacterium]
MILITGATGFLGRRVVRQLSQRHGETLRCLVRPGSDPREHAALFRDLPNGRAIEYFPASFNDLDALKRAVDGASIVYHVAASKSGSFAAQTANTVVGTENLLRASKDADLSRFVLVSSFAVMGVAGLPKGAVVDESTPLEAHPEWRDPYAYAKQRQERLALDYLRQGVPVVVVRPGVIYGPGADVLTIRVGVSMFGWFLFLGGANSVPLTYVDNCADAVVAAGAAEDVVGEVLNVCDHDLPTAREIFRLYRRRVGRVRYVPIPFPLLKVIARINVWYSEKSRGNLPIVFSPYQVDTIWKRQRFSNAKATKLLGWQPRVSVKEGLELALASRPGG